MDSVKTKLINDNTIGDAAAAINGIIHAPGVGDKNGNPNPIFTLLNNPNPDVDKYSDYGKESDDENDTIKQVVPLEVESQ